MGSTITLCVLVGGMMGTPAGLPTGGIKQWATLFQVLELSGFATSEVDLLLRSLSFITESYLLIYIAWCYHTLPQPWPRHIL